MRYSKYYLILVAIVGLSFYSCSDIKDDLTAPSKISVHDLSFLNPGSLNFHAVTVKEKGLESCKQCHAAKFDGGTANKSCATSNCHPNIAVHQNGINNPASANYHGKYIATKKIPMSDCNQCHGNNYTGGTASPACTNCHSKITTHKIGISDPASSNFHGKFIASLNWDMTKCTGCHGNNYAGGVASPSCNKCHTNADGPEACNTCHGNFSNPSLIAPPVDRNRKTEVTLASVGAHSTHLLNAKISPLVKCSDCHVVPTALNSPGHIDTTPKAEVILTAKYSDYQNGNGTYDASTNKCSNTYCHGNFSFSKATSQWSFAYTADKIEGENFQPTWNTVDGTQTACGTCHGLPPKGHMAADLKACATCHQGVVDEYGKIIDKTKHMNGKIDVFGN
ncbi:MAG: CxxxxCH/CxxCH domain-containing protein [Melioribacteraceae bacterium]